MNLSREDVWIFSRFKEISVKDYCGDGFQKTLNELFPRNVKMATEQLNGEIGRIV